VDFPNHSCFACAWKEEQLRIAAIQQSHGKNKKPSSSERILQHMADALLPSSPSSSDEGLVKPSQSPLNCREIKYASLLSHAIQ
jgi:hypothetical protein